MAECIICDIIEGKLPSKKLFEDDDILAFLDLNGANEGHTFIVPKKHYPIFEQVPDDITAKLFSLSNKISTSVFEALNAQGTNIFVTNGVSAGQTVAHFVINIIPRKEGDKVNLQWKPKQLSEEEMSTVELMLKDQAKNISVGGAQKDKNLDELEQKKENISSDEENYLWKSVNRKIS